MVNAFLVLSPYSLPRSLNTQRPCPFLIRSNRTTFQRWSDDYGGGEVFSRTVRTRTRDRRNIYARRRRRETGVLAKNHKLAVSARALRRRRRRPIYFAGRAAVYAVCVCVCKHNNTTRQQMQTRCKTKVPGMAKWNSAAATAAARARGCGLNKRVRREKTDRTTARLFAL